MEDRIEREGVITIHKGLLEKPHGNQTQWRLPKM